MVDGGGKLAVNWLLAWYESHRTAKLLVDEGTIGDDIEVHYYDGNKGSGRFMQIKSIDSDELHFAGTDLEDTDEAVAT